MTERMSQEERDSLEDFLGAVLDDYSKGTITRQQVINGIAAAYITAADGRRDEAVAWLRKGRKWIHQDKSVESGCNNR